MIDRFQFPWLTVSNTQHNMPCINGTLIFLQFGDLARLNAFQRSEDSIPEIVLPYSFLNNDQVCLKACFANYNQIFVFCKQLRITINANGWSNEGKVREKKEKKILRMSRLLQKLSLSFIRILKEKYSTQFATHESLIINM